MQENSKLNYIYQNSKKVIGKVRKGYSISKSEDLLKVIFMVLEDSSVQFKEIRYLTISDFEKDKNPDIDFFWTIKDLDYFYDKYLEEKNFEIKILEVKPYDSSVKLSKPKELKGVKAFVSIKFNKHCTNQCFKAKEDLYIKVGDYFSPLAEQIIPSLHRCYSLNQQLVSLGIPQKSNKFIYADNFGSVVLKNTAWIKFEDYFKIVSHIEKKDRVHTDILLNKLCTMVYESADLKYRLEHCEWFFFFERLLSETIF